MVQGKSEEKKEAKYGSGLAYETGIYGVKIDPPTHLQSENNNLVSVLCVMFGE